MFRQQSDRRVLEQVNRRQLQSQFVAQPAMYLDQQERMAAEVEKVIVETDLFDIQHFTPDLCLASLQLTARRRVRKRHVAPAHTRFRQTATIDLSTWSARQPAPPDKKFS